MDGKYRLRRVIFYISFAIAVLFLTLPLLLQDIAHQHALQDAQTKMNRAISDKDQLLEKVQNNALLLTELENQGKLLRYLRVEKWQIESEANPNVILDKLRGTGFCSKPTCQILKIKLDNKSDQINLSLILKSEHIPTAINFSNFGQVQLVSIKSIADIDLNFYRQRHEAQLNKLINNNNLDKESQIILSELQRNSIPSNFLRDFTLIEADFNFSKKFANTENKGSQNLSLFSIFGIVIIFILFVFLLRLIIRKRSFTNLGI